MPILGKYSYPVIILSLFLILTVTFLSFLPSLENDILHWDDPGNLTQNILVRKLSPGNIYKIFTTPVMAVYVPLTILSFAVEYHFFQFNPFVYHLDNLLLHLAVTALVFVFLLRLGLSWRAAFLSTLIFAVHPTRVESVAWITERKDVLYAFFYLLALNHYWSYLVSRKKRYFVLSLGWGALSILAKPMALSLPLVLLLCDWFYGRKIQAKIFLEKMAFMLYILPPAFFTYFINLEATGYTFFQGLLLVSWGLSFYIKKFLWPVNLLTIYNMPQPVDYFNSVYNSSILVVLAFFLFIFYFRKNRKVLFGALFFVSSIFFLLRSHAGPGVNFVADRFMYLPALGFCIMVSHFVDRGLIACRKRKDVYYALHVFLILILLVLSYRTFQLTKIWKSDLSLWKYVCRLSPQDPLAFANRGVAYHQRARSDLALKDFNRALELDPDHIAAYNNRGVIYLEQGKSDLALNDFNKAISLKFDYAQAYFNRGRLYFKRDDTDQALKDFGEAITLDPFFMPAYMARGEIYSILKKYEEALADYRQVLTFDPLNTQAYTMQAHIYHLQQRHDLLVELYTQFLKTFPKDAQALNRRGIAYTLKGDFELAKNDFDQALKLAPDNAEAYNNRGNIYFRLSKFDRALEDFQKAVTFNPRYLEAYNNLGNMYLIKRQYAQAIENYTQAINLNGRMPGFFYQRSWALAKLGDFKPALQDARMAQSLGLPGLENYINGLEQLVASEAAGISVQRVLEDKPQR